MTDKTIKHFIFMRFFSFQSGNYPYNVLNVDFLKEQLPLTRNALRSLENQTNKNFEIFFVMHPNFFDNPKYEFIFSTLKVSTILSINFVKNIPLTNMFNTNFNPELSALLKDAYDNYDFVITTKMDFDDFAFKEAVQDTQSKVAECDNILIYGYNNGYQYVQGNLYPLYYGDHWGERGHHSVFQSLIVNSSVAKKLPYFSVSDFPHNNIAPQLKEFLENNGVEYSEDMFQQNVSAKAYIYFKHEYSLWTLRRNAGVIKPERPRVKSGTSNPNRIRLTSKDITKEQLKEDFGFFYDVNLNDQDFSLQQSIQVSSSFRPYLTARIDMRMRSDEGDFQILSVSDNKAVVLKPKYLQKGGIGYQIESYLGHLVISAKSTLSGKIDLRLRGIVVRNQEDPSKIVPYWIDYTSLTVNDKQIFDELTPVWHNKPYSYTLDVEAGEVISLQLTWLPHRSDT